VGVCHVVSLVMWGIWNETIQRLENRESESKALVENDRRMDCNQRQVIPGVW
jgi:hypothetical protein